MAIRSGILSEQAEEEERSARDEIRAAEQKLRTLKDRRSALLSMVRSLAQEALDLQDRRIPLQQEVEAIHQRHRDLGKTLGEIRAEREAVRSRVAEILEALRATRDQRAGAETPRPESIVKEISLLERRQQTTVMSVKDENALIARIRQLRGQLTEAQKAEATWKAKDETLHGLKDELDKARKRMDDLGAKFEEVRKERDALMSQVKERLLEVGHLLAEIRAKGTARTEHLARVTELSQQIDELERSVMAMHRQSFQRRDEARKAYYEHNRGVRQTFSAEEILSETAERSLQELLKKGKIELRG